MSKKSGGNLYGPFSSRSDPRKRKKALRYNKMLKRISYNESSGENNSSFKSKRSPRKASYGKNLNFGQAIAQWKEEFGLKDFQESILDIITNAHKMDQYQIAEKIRKTVSGIRRRVSDLVVSMTDLMKTTIEESRKDCRGREEKMGMVVKELTNQLEYHKREKLYLLEKHKDLKSRIKTYQRQITDYKHRLSTHKDNNLVSILLEEVSKKNSPLMKKIRRNSNMYGKNKRKQKIEVTTSDESSTSSSEEEQEKNYKRRRKKQPFRSNVNNRTPIIQRGRRRRKKSSPPLRIELTSSSSSSESESTDEENRSKKEITSALDKVLNFEKRTRKSLRKINVKTGKKGIRGRRKRIPQLKTPTLTPSTHSLKNKFSTYGKKKSPVRRKRGKKKIKIKKKKKKKKMVQKIKTSIPKRLLDKNSFTIDSPSDLQRQSNRRKISISSLLQTRLQDPSDLHQLDNEWVFEPSQKLKSAWGKKTSRRNSSKKMKKKKNKTIVEEKREGEIEIEEKEDHKIEPEKDDEENQEATSEEEEEEEEDESEKNRLAMIQARRGRGRREAIKLPIKREEQEEEEEEKESTSEEEEEEKEEEKEKRLGRIRSPPNRIKVTTSSSSESETDEEIEDEDEEEHFVESSTFLTPRTRPSPSLPGSPDDEVFDTKASSSSSHFQNKEESRPVRKRRKSRIEKRKKTGDMFAEQLKKFGNEYLLKGKGGKETAETESDEEEKEDKKKEEESDSDDEEDSDSDDDDEEDEYSDSSNEPISPPSFSNLKKPTLKLKKKKVLKIHHKPVEVIMPRKRALIRAESFEVTKQMPLHKRAMLQSQQNHEMTPARSTQLNDIQKYIFNRNKRNEQEQEQKENNQIEENKIQEKHEEEEEDRDDSDSEEDSESSDSGEEMEFPSLAKKKENSLVNSTTESGFGGMSITLSSPGVDDEQDQKSEYDTSSDEEKDDDDFDQPQMIVRSIKLKDDDDSSSEEENDDKDDNNKRRRKGGMKLPVPKINITPTEEKTEHHFKKFKPKLSPIQITKELDIANRITCPSPKEIVEDLVKQHGVPRWKSEKIRKDEKSPKKKKKRSPVSLASMGRIKSMSEIKSEIVTNATTPNSHEPIRSPIIVNPDPISKHNVMKFPSVKDEQQQKTNDNRPVPIKIDSPDSPNTGVQQLPFPGISVKPQQQLKTTTSNNNNINNNDSPPRPVLPMGRRTSLGMNPPLPIPQNKKSLFVNRPVMNRRMSLGPANRPSIPMIRNLVKNGAVRRGIGNIPLPVQSPLQKKSVGPPSSPITTSAVPKPANPFGSPGISGVRKGVMNLPMPVSPQANPRTPPMQRSSMYTDYLNRRGSGGSGLNVPGQVTSSRNNILQSMAQRRTKRSMSMYAQRTQLSQF